MSVSTDNQCFKTNHKSLTLRPLQEQEIQVSFQIEKEGFKESTLTMKTENELISLSLTGQIIYPKI